MKQIKIYRKENLIYIANNQIDSKILEKFNNLVVERRSKICKLLKLDVPKNKIFYFINFESVTKEHGHADKNCIYVYIRNLDELLVPYHPMFIHEETHNITLNYWPFLNDFLIEGIAEYCLFTFTNRDYLSVYRYYYSIFPKYSSLFLLEKNGQNRPKLNYLGNILIHYISNNYSIIELKEMLSEYSSSLSIITTRVFKILEKYFYSVLYYSIGFISLRFFSNDHKINYFYELFFGNERLIKNDDKYIDVEIVEYDKLCMLIPSIIRKMKNNYIGFIMEFDIRFFYNSFLIVFDYRKEKMYIGIREEKISKTLYFILTQVKDVIKKFIARDKITVLHAALVTKNKKNILIIGDSETGKSTLAYRLFKEKKFKIANDDMLIFDFVSKKIYARTNSVFLAKESIKFLDISNFAIPIGVSIKSRLIVDDVSCIISDVNVLLILTKKSSFYYINDRSEIIDLIKDKIFTNNCLKINEAAESLITTVKKCVISSYDQYIKIKKMIK